MKLNKPIKQKQIYKISKKKKNRIKAKNVIICTTIALNEQYTYVRQHGTLLKKKKIFFKR